MSEQARDHAGAVRLGRGEQGRAAVGVARVGERGIRREQALDGSLLPALDRGEELGDPLGARRRVEVGAKRAPAREAVLPRHRELGVGQARTRVRAAQPDEPVLGELLQILEAGTIGEGHDAPSFHVPGVRGIGRKVVMSPSNDRWVRPFTRTVSRLDGCPPVYDGAPPSRGLV
jgi:hypothetical protein